MTIPVTMVTRDASLDDLSLSDYRDIYDELRGRDPVAGTYAISLDKFVTLVTSVYSKAQWSKYHNGEAVLTRTMRNELRHTVGLPALPATVAEATAAASPDAAVWQVGIGPAEHVIMVTTQEPITLHVNGAVSVGEPQAKQAAGDDVTAVTRTEAQLRYIQAQRERRAAQNARRNALGAKWPDVIEAGLAALENQKEQEATHP